MISRDAFLSKFGRRYKTLTLPISGDELRIRNLTGREMQEFRASLVDKAGKVIRERWDTQDELLIARCVVDADGRPMFTEADVDAMAEMDGGLIEWLAKQCKDWTGFRADNDWSPIVDAAKN